MGGEPGDHRKAETVQVIGELVRIGTIDAGIDQDQPTLPAHRDGMLQTHAVWRTQTPSATWFSIDWLCQVPPPRRNDAEQENAPASSTGDQNVLI
jgi:hypothetical protein